MHADAEATPRAGPVRPVAFLDRDGIINERAAEHDYVLRPEQFHFVPGALPLLVGLRDLGYALVVITNQQGVGKGLMTDDALRSLHGWMSEALAAEGVQLAGIYACTHLASAGCACRKPKPGLIHRALRDLPFRVDLARSVMIGDTASDIEAGRAGGVRTLLLVDRLVREPLAEGARRVATVVDALALLQSRTLECRAPGRG